MGYVVGDYSPREQSAEDYVIEYCEEAIHAHPTLTSLDLRNAND